MEYHSDISPAEQKPFQNEEFLNNINTIDSDPIQEISTGDNSIKNDLLQILNDKPVDDSENYDINTGSPEGVSSGEEDKKEMDDQELFPEQDLTPPDQDLTPLDQDLTPPDQDLTPHNDQKPFNDGNFTCNICQKKCDDITDLSEHLTSHSYKVFPCDVCHEIFFNKKRLKDHKKLAHPKKKKTKTETVPAEKPDKKEIILTRSEDDKTEKASKDLESGDKQPAVRNYYEVDFHKEFRCDHCHKAFDR